MYAGDHTTQPWALKICANLEAHNHFKHLLAFSQFSFKIVLFVLQHGGVYVKRAKKFDEKNAKRFHKKLEVLHKKDIPVSITCIGQQYLCIKSV